MNWNYIGLIWIYQMPSTNFKLARSWSFSANTIDTWLGFHIHVLFSWILWIAYGLWCIIFLSIILCIDSISLVSQTNGWKKTAVHTCWIMSRNILLPAPFGPIKIWIVQLFSTVKLTHDECCTSAIYGKLARFEISTLDSFILLVYVECHKRQIIATKYTLLIDIYDICIFLI